MLALDCDGVVVGPHNVVPGDIVDTLVAAESAGWRVCLATGRSFVETLPVWRQISLRGPEFEPLVVAGGAKVAEVPSGRTLHQQTIQLHLAAAVSGAMADAGYCAMALVDVWQHGVDYYITDTGNVDEVVRRWFSQMDVQVRRVTGLADAPGMPEPLRISAVVDPADGKALVGRLRQQLDGQLELHAILAPKTIVEAFAAQANKFTAICHVAQARQIPPERIVAVGDDVNDIPMLIGAGLGAAMPHEPDNVKPADDVVAENGLAAFVSDLLNKDCA
jgi:hydroxymethylpyrimidine pyrophosphatase-like HAD family hydrolase